MASRNDTSISEPSQLKIRSNYDELTRRMNPERLTTLLYAKLVISAEDRDEVQAERTRFSKCKKLLSVLERGTERGFHEFVEGLRASEQNHLANLLEAPFPGRSPSARQLSPMDVSPESPSQRLRPPVEEVQPSDAADRGSSVNVVDAAHDENRIPVTLPRLPIKWDRYLPEFAGTTVTVSAETFIGVKEHLRKKEIYLTNHARKGKMCIIALPQFKVRWLKKLEGYAQDEKKLINTWRKLGFEVHIPKVDNRCLSKLEFDEALQVFAASLTDADQMAGLCILTHGGDGHIYTADGKTVWINDIMATLDNINCCKMRDKPKILIIHACQGEKRDTGILVPAAGPTVIPHLADMVICYPTMPGYVCFVHPKSGSLYINKLCECLEKEAGCTDFCDVLTKLNDIMYKSAIAGGELDEKERTTVLKEMSNYRSCLRKKLYLLPTINGQDWKLNDT